MSNYNDEKRAAKESKKHDSDINDSLSDNDVMYADSDGNEQNDDESDNDII